MLTLNPPSSLASLRKEMDRLFERFWDVERPEFGSFGEWAPWMDIVETKEALIVRAEVPGIEPKEIQVTLQDQTLTIRGDKKEEKEEKAEKFYRSERAYGSFARSVRLPISVEPNKVQAVFHNGLLTITLPKAASEKGHLIPVKPE